MNSSSLRAARLFAALVAMVTLLVMQTAFAIPNEISLQGKLTNANGYSASGTYNMSFKIYDSFTNGTILYQVEQNVSTDANGVYDTTLRNINLNFSDQYYLGITIGTDNESLPRINLTSSPYAFRSNVSESLNPVNAYTVGQLMVTGDVTLGSNASAFQLTSQNVNISPSGNIETSGNATMGQRLSFMFGNIIDNFALGFLRLTGNVVITNNLTVGDNALFVDSTNNLVGIGTTTPGAELEVVGDAKVSGQLNVTSINATSSITVRGNAVQEETPAFKLENFTSVYDSRTDRFGNTNFTTLYDARGDRFGVANFTALNTGAFNLGNYSAEYASTGYKEANLSSDLAGGVASTIATTTLTADTIIVNKNLYVIGNISNTNVANLNVNGSLYPAIDNYFSIGNGSSRWKDGNFTGTLQAGTLSAATITDGTATITGGVINAPTIQVSGSIVQVEANGFKIGNYTALENAAFMNENFTANFATHNTTSSQWNTTSTAIFNRDFGKSVGIWTSDPQYVLDVAGSIRGSNTLILGIPGEYGQIDYTRGTTDNLYIRNIYDTGNPLWGNIVFETKNSAVTAMTIQGTTGNIGIGTTAPLSTLHVNGSGNSGGLRVTNDSGYTAFFVNSTSGNVGIGTTSPTSKLQVSGVLGISDGNAGLPAIAFSNELGTGIYRATTGTIGFQGLSTGMAILSGAVFRVNSGIPIGWASGSVDGTQIDTGFSRLSINKIGVGNGVASDVSGTLIAGSVGIGTTSPAEKLSVIGNISATGNLSIGGNVFVTGTVIDNGTLNRSIDLSGYAQTSQLSMYQVEADGFKSANFSVLNVGAFNLGNYSAEYASTGFKIVNFTTLYDAQGAVRFDNENASMYLITNGYLSTLNATAIGILLQNSTINRSIDLSGYVTTSQSGAYLTNNSPANLSSLNVNNTLFVNGSRVGIGTSSPSELLEIKNTGGTAYLKYVSGGSTLGGFSGIDPSGNLYLWNYDAKSLYLGTNSNPRLTIDSSGNSVFSGDITADGQITSQIVNQYGIRVQQGSSQGSFYFGASDAVTTPDGVFSNNAGTELFRITNAGNVGIGQTSPNVTFGVSGSANITGILYATNANITNVLQAGTLSANTITGNSISALSYDFGWTNLSNYPAACPAGQVVSAVGDTLTCVEVAAISSSAGGWNNDSANTYTAKNVVVDTTMFVINTTLNRVGINTATLGAALEIVGDVKVSGQLNVTSINATSSITVRGNEVQEESQAFKFSNFTSAYDARGDRFGVANFTALNTGAFNLLNFTTAYDSRNDRFGNANATTLLDNNTIVRAGNATFVTSQSVGGEVSGTVGSITLSDTALDDQYVLRENSSLVQAGNITFVTSQSVGGEVSGTVGSVIIGPLLQRVADAFNAGNFTSRLTGFFGYGSVSELNASLIQRTNTSWVVSTIDSQYPNLDTDSTDDFGLAQLDNNTIVRAGNLSSVVRTPDAFNNANFTSRYDARLDRFGVANFTALNTGAFNLGNYSSEYASTGYKEANLSSDLAGGVASTISTTTLTADTIIVNKNLYVIGNISNTNVANLNVNGSLYPALDDFFSVGNGSLRWKNGNFSGTVQAGTFSAGTITDGTATITGGVINAPTIQVSGSIVQVEANGFKIGNFTTAYDSRSDRFGNGNFTTLYDARTDRFGNGNFTSQYGTEYGSTGFKKANVTEYLGGTGANETLIRSTNTTFFGLFSKVADAFNLGNFTTAYDSRSDRFGNTNFTTLYDARSDRFGVANYTSLENAAFKNANFTTLYDARTDRFGNGNASALGLVKGSDFNLGNISNSTLVKGDNATLALWNTTSTAIFNRDFGKNVGIGDTSPDFGLDVIVADGSGWAGKFASSDSVSGVLLGTRGGEGSITGITSAGAADVLTLNPDGGNVGIGTTAPGKRLEVVGDVYHNLSDASKAFQIVNGSGTSLVYVNSSTGYVGIGTNDPQSDLHILDTTGNALIQLAESDALLTNLYWDYTSNAAVIETASYGYPIWLRGSEIDLNSNTNGNVIIAAGGGKVGINTSTPTQTLTVQGTLNVTPAGLGSTPSLFVASNGNVGIGTASPNDLLEIAGNVRVAGSLNATSINATRIFARNGTAALPSYTFAEDTNTGLRLGGVDNVSIVTGGADRITVDASGNVGIGTTGPKLKLHIYDVSGPSEAPASSGTTPTGYAVVGSDFNNNLYMGSMGSSPYAFWLQAQDSDNLATTYALALNPNGGNVGIGTTGPSAKLDVSGGSAMLSTDGSFFRSGANDVATMAVGLKAFGTTIGQYAGVELQRTNVIGGLQKGEIRFFTTDIAGAGEYQQRMVIQHDGNVGIGQTSPNVTLGVSGSANITGILYAKSINVTNAISAAAIQVLGQDVQVEANGFKIANYTALEAASFQNLNFTTLYDARLDRFGVANFTALNTGAFNLGNYSVEYGSSGFKAANFSALYDAQAGTRFDNENASAYLITNGYLSTLNATAIGILIQNSTINRSISLSGYVTTTQAGAYLTNNSPANLSFLNVNNTLFVNGSMVGIGTNAPVSALDVGTGDITLNGGQITAWDTVGTGKVIHFKSLLSGASRTQVEIYSDTQKGTIDLYDGNNAVGTHLTGYGVSYFNNSNVGIGTSNPVYPLNVVSAPTMGDAQIAVQSNSGTNVSYAGVHGISTAGRAFYLTVADASNADWYGAHAGDVTLAATANAKLHLRAGAVDTGLTMDTSGSVGIGTTAPGDKLTVGDGITAGGVYIDVDAPLANGAGISFSKGGTAKATIYVPAGTGDLRFFDNTADRMTILNGGNVGIGTTAPTQKLDVNGSINVSSTIYVSGGNIIQTGINGISADNFKVTGNNNPIDGIGIYNIGSGGINFYEQGLVKMVLDDDGNVGIGQTSPNVTLGVSGSANITNVLWANHANFTTLRGIPLSQFNYSIDLSSYALSSQVPGQFLYSNSNITEYLGGTGANDSLIRSTNSTFFGLFSKVADAFNIGNLTNYFGDSSFNATVIRSTNTSWFNTNFNSQFGTANITSSLWNSTSTAIFQRDLGKNVGIGTTTPSKALVVNSTTTANAITFDPSASTPLINTTGNNLTISSATGSVIIRLG